MIYSYYVANEHTIQLMQSELSFNEFFNMDISDKEEQWYNRSLNWIQNSLNQIFNLIKLSNKFDHYLEMIPYLMICNSKNSVNIDIEKEILLNIPLESEGKILGAIFLLLQMPKIIITYLAKYKLTTDISKSIALYFYKNILNSWQEIDLYGNLRAKYEDYFYEMIMSRESGLEKIG